MRKKVSGTDLEVSAVGLGCMGMNHAYGAPADKREMVDLIAQALDLGYTLFDTAEVVLTHEEVAKIDAMLGKLPMSEVFGGARVKK